MGKTKNFLRLSYAEKNLLNWMTSNIPHLNKVNYIQGCLFLLFSQEKSQNVDLTKIG